MITSQRWRAYKGSRIAGHDSERRELMANNATNDMNDTNDTNYTNDNVTSNKPRFGKMIRMRNIIKCLLFVLINITVSVFLILKCEILRHENSSLRKELVDLHQTTEQQQQQQTQQQQQQQQQTHDLSPQSAVPFKDYAWLSRGSILEYYHTTNQTHPDSNQQHSNISHTITTSTNTTQTWETATIAHIDYNYNTFDLILNPKDGQAQIIHNLTMKQQHILWRIPRCNALTRLKLKYGPKTSPQPKLTGDFLNRFIIIPEYKLLFCYIDKVGATMFSTLFNALRIMHPNISKPEAKYLNTDIYLRNKMQHFGFQLQDIQHFLTDPNWTKAVFYRHPLDRFLSAYRSKCEQRDADGAKVCHASFGHESTSTSFTSALHSIAQKGRHETYLNPHFAEMADFCGGLQNTLPYYDIVHPLDKPTSQTAVAHMLAQIGVDTESIDTLLQHVFQTGGRIPEHTLHKIGLEKTVYHVAQSHDSKSKQSLGAYYPTHTEIRLVEEFYSRDFDLFAIPRHAQQNCAIKD